jgi:YfiH family protein
MAEAGKPYLTAPRLERIPWLVHGFGSGDWREDDFARAKGLKGFRTVIMRQLHSDTVHRVEAPPSSRLSGDALITNVPGLLLIVRTADCLPVLLADEKNRAVASVHCGWRGTRVRILERAVREMERAFRSDPANLIAALGPCIGPACYEVGPEVKGAFESAGFPKAVLERVQVRPDKFLLDLRRANAWLLDGLGVKRANVWIARSCTHCDPGLVSYRRNKGEPRRMYNFIGIKY